MTILPRAATVGELASIRRDNQSSRLYLTVHQPATVYTARLAAVPSSNDNLASITYNSGSGTHTNILADMTMYVGTSAGAYDLGMVRIRNTTGIGATSGTFNLGMLSEVAWASGAYLTVVDEFALWPRWPRVTSDGTVYMDYDVAYVNQHRYCKSFPIFPRVAVKWLPVGGTVNVIRDGSQSWALNNTINAYTWVAPGNAGISGDTTNTVTITYNAKNATAGYRVQLTVGNTDSADSIGYGRVFVLQDESDAITQFTAGDISGSWSEGGWSCNVTCYAEAGLTQIRDRAMVVLHRRDYYGNTLGSLGYVADDENIEMVGWIDGETIKWETDDQSGWVTFKVVGPQVMLDKLTMPTAGLKNLNKHPSNWKRFQGLTAKSATWHILMWRTTAPVMMDCFAIDSGVAALQLQSGGAQTVWSQIKNILNDFLIAAPCCDAYGRLFMQREQQCLSAADRSGIPTVVALTKGDWGNDIDFDRQELNKIAGVDLTGEVYNGTNVTTPVYTLAPGRTFQHRGSNIFSRNGLAVVNQAELNALGAAILGWQNNPYPKWRLQLPSNFHLCDIAPYQYLSLSVASSDTARAITLSNLRVIPRRIVRNFSDLKRWTEITVEAESSIGLSVTGDTPATAPDIPATPPPVPPTPPPDPIPTPSGNAREIWFATSDRIYWTGDFTTGDPTWNVVVPPVGFGIDDFVVAKDGSAIYIHGTTGAAEAIRSCTNPKDVSPTWNAIATTGDTIGGVVVQVNGLISINNTTLVTLFYRPSTGNTYYAVYNGTSWSLTLMSSDYAIQSVYQYELAIHSPAGLLFWLIDLTNSMVQEWFGPFGGFWSRAWRNQIGGGIYIATYSNTDGVDVRNALTNTVVLNVPSGTSGQPQGYTIRSAFSGPHTYVTNVAGALYLSDDGVTFAETGVGWARGYVFDAALTGGGSLIWILISIPASNVPARLYNRDGSVLRDLTGNIWSIMSGSKTVYGAGVVYQ